jgi:two-component system nitrate/nitrite response regulator NarL
MPASVKIVESSPDGDVAPASIKTYVLHTELLVAESLRLALDQEPDIDVVGSQSTPALAVERILQSAADVVLLDVSLDAVDVAARLQRSSVPPKVIVTSTDTAAELLLPCVEAGVVGFLPNRATLTEIASAVRRAHAGWSIFTIEQVSTIIEGRARRPSHAFAVEACVKLSLRERQVLQVLATGASIAETGAELGMSAHTAQTHLKNAMRKLNATSKLAAVMIAIRGGVIAD